MAEEEKQVEQKTAMIIVAHPDDAEFMAGGTLATWAKEGWRIVYVLITDGNHGSHDPTMTAEKLVQVRQIEQVRAAQIIGATSEDIIFLHYVDSELFDSMPLRIDIARQIRRYRPQRIFVPDPATFYSGQRYTNHPDHRIAGEAALAAIMPIACTPLCAPQLAEEGLEAWKPQEVFLGMSNQPEVWFDIAASIEAKINALKQHESQLDISKLEAMMRERARQTAQLCTDGRRLEYAESFKYIRFS